MEGPLRGCLAGVAAWKWGGGCLSTRRSTISAGGPPNQERASEEAGRRARAKIRRYAAACEQFLEQQMPVTYAAFVASGRVAP